MDKCLLSTGKDNWETPQLFFDLLNSEFGFTLDAASDGINAKCEKFYTPEQDGLAQDWAGETVFCNPPYSKGGKKDEWIKKCYEESRKPNTTVVALVPVRTDTARFHDHILGKAEIRFIRGRLAFEMQGQPIKDKKGNTQRAPFPSMLVVWRTQEVDEP